MSTKPIHALEPGGPRVRWHLTAGWLGLLIFLGLGLVLEALHALKSPTYLDVGQTTRRFLWTLAHAHGTLFSLMQIAMGLSGRAFPQIWRQGEGWVGWGMLGGQVLMPAGFLLGGTWTVGEDPGWGVFLAPVGAVSLLVGVAVAGWNLLSAPSGLDEVPHDVDVNVDDAGGGAAAPNAAVPPRRTRRRRN